MHDRLGMTDGAWPAEDEIDEVILLYKTSVSNLESDFYVLPFYNISIISILQDPSFPQFLIFGDYKIAIDIIQHDAIEYSEVKTDNSR